MPVPGKKMRSLIRLSNHSALMVVGQCAYVVVAAWKCLIPDCAYLHHRTPGEISLQIAQNGVFNAR